MTDLDPPFRGHRIRDMGEEAAKDTMPKATYDRLLKVLREAGLVA